MIARLFPRLTLFVLGALMAAFVAACSPPAATGVPMPAATDAPYPMERPASAKESPPYYPPATGGTDPVNDAAYDATFYKHYGVNPFIDTEDDHLSTFAMDVDSASYTVARRYIMDGNMPEPDSVRVEEFVNYFHYDYAPPTEGAFAIHLDGAPSRFGNSNHRLLRVGLKAREIPDEERQDATLIYVIDVSGSMERENRLGLVKRSLHLLLDELRPGDEVGIVIYGSRGQILLPVTSAKAKDDIMAAIDRLSPSGSTNAEEGLKLAYQMAAEAMRPGRITRLILCSDGVANVGNTGPDSILQQVRAYVDDGVTLSTVGFGMGNYNDVLMEQLADNGDGNYYYVDTLEEARRVFVENLTGTLQVVARDAKIQVDFNPAVVKSYRLLGYENRRVADDDFRNDRVDAGEVGAGHSVTALYELKFYDDAQGQAARVLVRYADPQSGEVTELHKDIDRADFLDSFEAASPRFKLAAAVAEFAEILRQSYWAQDSSLDDVLSLARDVSSQLPEDADVAEFASLVARASDLK